MTTFDRREEAFENRFAHDEDLRFRAEARRASKMARWAAGLMGKAEADGDAYAQTMVELQVGGGPDAVLARLRADLAGAGVTISEHQLGRHMAEAMVEAQRDVHQA